MAKQSKADAADAPGALNSAPLADLSPGQAKISKQQKMDKILDLTEGGASIRQISERLTELGWKGVSRSQVGLLLKKALEQGMAQIDLKAKHHIELALRKEGKKELALLPNYLRLLDEDRRCIQETGKSKNYAAIKNYGEALERVTKRIDALLGNTKPAKVEVTGADGVPLETSIRVIMPTLPDMEQPEE
ncbi:hypothetical protein BH10ACI2_BH10ACI2_04200 [soil metagenome]